MAAGARRGRPPGRRAGRHRLARVRQLRRPVGELSAVLRSWEDRFGARLVAAGFDTLRLSVAAPPLSAEHALRVAAEHFALCPDNVWQGSVETLAEYAAELEDLNMWTFWWD